MKTADRVPVPPGKQRGRRPVDEPLDSTISTAVTEREHDAMIRLASANRAQSTSSYWRRVVVFHLRQHGVLPTD